MNTISLIANLTADPRELRPVKTKDGETVVTDFRVAYNDPRAPEGADADYFSVTVWGAQAENAVKYLRKGREVAIEGRLKHEPWTSEAGEKHHDVKIVARSAGEHRYRARRSGPLVANTDRQCDTCLGWNRRPAQP